MCIVQRPYIKDSIGARPNMTSVFDFDDSINTAYNAKMAGKNLVTAKHEVLTKAGDFLFLAHSDKEFALRCQMMEADIESAAKRKMATVSDSKFKLVRALHEEWKIRHANCDMCNLKVAELGGYRGGDGPKPMTAEEKLDSKEKERLRQESMPEDVQKEKYRKFIEGLGTSASKTATSIPDDPAEYREFARQLKERLRKPLSSKSGIQEKIASLQTRLGMAMELDKTDPNKSVNSITSGLGEEAARALAARYAGRTADRPEMAKEAKAGRWAMITKHNAKGEIIDSTLGRIGGSSLGGDAEVSPLICTGNTHHGQHGPCVHPGDDAFDSRHIALQETPAMLHGGRTLFPRIQGRKEASIYAPSHRVYILPEEEHKVIEGGMNKIAAEGVPALSIPPFKREEEGRGRAVETFGRGSEDSQAGPGVNTNMGRSLSVGKISGFTLWPSTKDFGHYENQLASDRGKGEGNSELLESGPRERKGVWGKTPGWGLIIPGQEGKAGSGRVLPVATMLPEYNKDDKAKGMSGALPDGRSAGVGVTARLRPVAWGNESDAPTFKFLGGGPIRAVGEKLLQKLTALNTERTSRIGKERAERATTSPSGTPRTPKKQQVSQDILNQILGD